jgi:hypothetical protein
MKVADEFALPPKKEAEAIVLLTSVAEWALRPKRFDHSRFRKDLSSELTLVSLSAAKRSINFLCSVNEFYDHPEKR